MSPPPESALRRSGEVADKSFRAQRADEPVLPCRQKTWVEVRLVDAEGRPVPHEPFRLKLGDGRVIEGTLDENGLAGADGIDPSDDCELTFPNFRRMDAILEG